MVRDSAAHLFHDGDLRLSLRDWSIWPTCSRGLRRASATSGPAGLAGGDRNLGRPLFYALRYCRRLLRVAVPESVSSAAARYGPPLPIIEAMDRMVPRALVPGLLDGAADRSAAMLLYIRSHWLRMPPWLLADTDDPLARFRDGRP